MLKRACLRPRLVADDIVGLKQAHLIERNGRVGQDLQEEALNLGDPERNGDIEALPVRIVGDQVENFAERVDRRPAEFIGNARPRVPIEPGNDGPATSPT